MMRRFAGMLLPLALFAATPAQAGDAAVEEPIQKFLDSFNKGDVAGATATMTASVAITDEFAPFHWTGPGAFVTWAKNFDTDAKAKGITEPGVALRAPTRELVEGDHAYVIAPATYTFTQKGVKMAEVAQMTFGLTKVGTEWKITAWTWTGPDATPVK